MIKAETTLKKWIRTASHFIDLIQFHLIWQMLDRSLEAEKDNFCVVFTYSIKQACETGNFPVAWAHRRQKNVQNSLMHVQICRFVNKNLLLFLPFSFRRHRRWFWWRDVILLSIFHWYISVIGAWFHWLRGLMAGRHGFTSRGDVTLSSCWLCQK